MDSTEKLDDSRARGRLLGHALAEHPAGQQDSQAGTRVGIYQEKHGVPHLGGLLDAQGGHDAMIHGVVQEDHFRGIDNQGEERIQFMFQHPVHPRAKGI